MLHWHRSNRKSLRRTALLALVAGAGLSACAGGPAMRAPFDQISLPAAVQVPVGHRVFAETSASGTIVYECRSRLEAGAAMAGQFEWVFVGPSAPLLNRAGQPAGRYFGPPATWEGIDGVRVTGAQVAVASAGVANIPLQLVRANAATGTTGQFAGTAFIQRVATEGGIAPALPCGATQTGERQTVSYKADYIFWRAN